MVRDDEIQAVRRSTNLAVLWAVVSICFAVLSWFA